MTEENLEKTEGAENNNTVENQPNSNVDLAEEQRALFELELIVGNSQEAKRIWEEEKKVRAERAAELQKQNNPEQNTEKTEPEEPEKTTPAAEKKVEGGEEKPFEIDTDNPLLSDLTAKQKAKIAEDLKDFESTAKFITDNTGIEIKDFKDIYSLVEKYKDIEANAEKLKVRADVAEGLESLISKSPEIIYGALQKYSNGEDYIAFLKNELQQTIDFSKPYEKQKLSDLLQYYGLGKKFNDVEDEDELREKADEAGLLPLLKQNFDKDQKAVALKREQEKERVKRQEAMYHQSLELAVQHINDSMPDLRFKEAHKKEVREFLDGGVQNILDLFYNNDGTLKKDAAATVALIKYGQKAITQLKEYVAKRVETKTTEEILTRGADKPKAPGGGGKATENPTLIVEKEMKRLLG